MLSCPKLIYKIDKLLFNKPYLINNLMIFNVLFFFKLNFYTYGSIDFNFRRGEKF